MSDLDDDQPVFARARGPHGKLDDEAKTKVDGLTLETFREICAAHGTDPSSALRNYIYQVVHGRSYDAMVLTHEHVAAQRRAVLFGHPGDIGAPDAPPLGDGGS